jgi:CheY-like chemotaxis protein
MAAILVVDDRPNVRLSLLLTLEASGFDVSEAIDGAHALEQVTEHPIHGILADIGPSTFNALQLKEAVRGKGLLPPRVVGVTSDRLDPFESVEVVRRSGFDCMLLRPFARHALLGALQLHGDGLGRPRSATLICGRLAG